MSSSKKTSSTTLLAVGLGVAVAGVAAYLVMSSSSATTDKPTKKDKKKKDKKKKDKKRKKTKTPTKAAPAADVASPSTTTPTPTPTPTTDQAAAAPPTTVVAPTTTNQQALQTEGMLSQDVILQFFEASDALLAQQSVKDALAAAYKNGENILDTLKNKQEAVWASLNIEAQFGFKNIQRTMTTPELMTEKVRTALVKAAAMEDSILTYALLGSKEKFEQEAAKLKTLGERAQVELNRELQMIQGQGQVAITKYTQDTMQRFKECTDGFENLDEIGRLKKRQQLSDAEYISIVKGQCLQQIMMQQHAQMGQMMQ
jgi:hypothetical protein